jgi:uncharacterized protein (TIGR03663 family)
MKQRVAFASALAVAIVVAASFRLPNLAVRPVHCDEAVHAVKFGDLLERGDYRYDPYEYHGPTLNYSSLPIARVNGTGRLSDVTETQLRLVPVLFGIALVGAAFLLRRIIGPAASLLAAMLVAVSPAMAFYSRYYIQETLLVFFTFVALIAAWRLVQAVCDAGDDGEVANKDRHVWGWCVVLGVSAGMMHATKETAAISIFAMTVAAALTCFGQFRSTLRKRAAYLICAFVISVLIAALVSAVLISRGFRYPHSILDSYTTYLKYIVRARGHGSAGAHVYPVYHYLQLLFWWRVDGGRLWSELPVGGLALAAVGLASFGRAASHKERAFVRYVVVYTLVVWCGYSAIPYKTPWCVLTPMQGVLLLAAIGGAMLVREAAAGWSRFVVWAGLTTVVVFNSYQTWAAVFVDELSEGNPYVYSATTRDVPLLASAIEPIAAGNSTGHGTPIQVMAPDDDYWPLPWYLRRWTRAGWYRDIPEGPAAPVIIVHASQESQLADYLYQRQPSGQRYLYVPLPRPDKCEDWLLRTGVRLRVYVRLDYWNTLP